MSESMPQVDGTGIRKRPSNRLVGALVGLAMLGGAFYVSRSGSGTDEGEVRADDLEFTNDDGKDDTAIPLLRTIEQNRSGVLDAVSGSLDVSDIDDLPSLPSGLQVLIDDLNQLCGQLAADDYGDFDLLDPQKSVINQILANSTPLSWQIVDYLYMNGDITFFEFARSRTHGIQSSLHSKVADFLVGIGVCGEFSGNFKSKLADLENAIDSHNGLSDFEKFLLKNTLRSSVSLMDHAFGVELNGPDARNELLQIAHENPEEVAGLLNRIKTLLYSDEELSDQQWSSVLGIIEDLFDIDRVNNRVNRAYFDIGDFSIEEFLGISESDLLSIDAEVNDRMMAQFIVDDTKSSYSNYLQFFEYMDDALVSIAMLHHGSDEWFEARAQYLAAKSVVATSYADMYSNYLMWPDLVQEGLGGVSFDAIARVALSDEESTELFELMH